MKNKNFHSRFWMTLFLGLQVALINILLFSSSAMAQVVNAPPGPGTNTSSSIQGRVDYSNSGVDKSITAFLCTPTQSSGANTPTTNDTVLGINAGTAAQNPTSQDLYNCINKLYRFGIAFGAIAGVFWIVLAGYYYISGSEKAIAKAKGYVGGVIIGLLIMLASFILLKQINPDLVRFRPIQPPQFTDPCPEGFDKGVCSLPSCEQLGLPGYVCKDQNGGIAVSNGNGGVASIGPCKSGFRTDSEASGYMSTVSVNAWNANKQSRSLSVTVQQCMVDKTKSAFANAYSSSEKFPIKNVGGYNFRPATGSTQLSAHGLGLAIDINSAENYYINGSVTVGDFYRPCPGTNCSPFSMPANGSVVQGFKSQGFGWGGDWRNFKDYMHFSCLPGGEQGRCF